MTTTQEILAGMLTENVGSHFLDSGGTPKFDENGKYIGSEHGYGRHVERNQGVDFEKIPSSTVHFSIYNNRLEIELEHNTYHWLEARCELSSELDDLFHGKFLEEVDADDDKNWLELMEAFPEWLAEQEDEDGERIYGDARGIYGEGEPLVINTYNHESLLSQVIQFVYFTNGSGEFVALQIHGGADVRGGYSKPRIFSVGNRSELDVFDDCQGTIYCTGKDHHPTALARKEFQEAQAALPGVEVEIIDFDSSGNHYWTTDDGCHFYDQGCCGGGHTNLEKMDVRNIDPEYGEDWEPGIVCVLDGIGYCPICGAKLAAGE